jgi:hypothetical protein
MWFEAANATGGIETMEGGKVGLRLLFEDVGTSTVPGDLKTSVSSPTHLSVGYHWCEACTFASRPEQPTLLEVHSAQMAYLAHAYAV